MRLDGGAVGMERNPRLQYELFIDFVNVTGGCGDDVSEHVRGFRHFLESGKIAKLHEHDVAEIRAVL